MRVDGSSTVKVLLRLTISRESYSPFLSLSIFFFSQTAERCSRTVTLRSSIHLREQLATVLLSNGEVRLVAVRVDVCSRKRVFALQVCRVRRVDRRLATFMLPAAWNRVRNLATMLSSPTSKNRGQNRGQRCRGVLADPFVRSPRKYILETALGNVNIFNFASEMGGRRCWTVFCLEKVGMWCSHWQVWRWLIDVGALIVFTWYFMILDGISRCLNGYWNMVDWPIWGSEKNCNYFRHEWINTRGQFAVSLKIGQVDYWLY